VDDTLVVAVEPGYPVTSVRLHGWLDLATAADLRSALLKVIADQPMAVLIDLSGTVVGDELALLAFSAVNRQASVWPGCQLVLYGATAETRRAFDRMAVSHMVLLCRDRWEALAQVARSPAPPMLTERLPPIPEAAGLARRLVSDACRQWGLARLVEPAEIIVTELVGNAVRHAEPPIHLSLAQRGRYLHVSVRDGSPRMPRRLTIAEPADHGRGLLLVDAFSTAWGSALRADGKVVWATLRLYPR
jgi:anti-anti-sigma regulatory factor